MFDDFSDFTGDFADLNGDGTVDLAEFLSDISRREDILEDSSDDLFEFSDYEFSDTDYLTDISDGDFY